MCRVYWWIEARGEGGKGDERNAEEIQAEDRIGLMSRREERSRE